MHTFLGYKGIELNPGVFLAIVCLFCRCCCFFFQDIAQMTRSLDVTQCNIILLIDLNVIFQTINFTDPFYAPPVVVVTPKQGYMNNYSGVSRSQCNAMTAWVEVSYQCRNVFDRFSC